VRAWNEPSCAGTHHSPHGLKATVEGASVRELKATVEGASVREAGECSSGRSPSAAAVAFSCFQLVTQVLFPCAAAQHDAAPPQQNSEGQAHAHSRSEHPDTPRPHAQCPASYYSCSEGGVIKHERANSSRTCSNRASSHSFPCSSQSYIFQICQRSTAVASRAISLHCMCTMLAGEYLFLLAEQASLFLLAGQRSSLYTCWQTSASFCVLSE